MNQYENQETFVSSVILCAGSSERMGPSVDKQFLLIGNHPVAYWAIQAFDQNPQIDEIIVVANRDVFLQMRLLVEKSRFQKVSTVVEGGSSRTASSRIGVSSTDSRSTHLLIHDGARPFVDQSTISRVVAACLQYQAAAPGIQLRETVKVLDEKKCIASTPNRERMYTVQTPQAFSKELYLQATLDLNESTNLFDDCQLIENIGATVHMVEGNSYNMKITTPEDILLAEAIHHSIKERRNTHAHRAWI